MARLYTNENFPLPAVEELRRLGHDVLTIHETGRGGQAISDEEVLGFARAEGRVMVTLNRRHFIRLHGSFPNTPGSLFARSIGISSLWRGAFTRASRPNRTSPDSSSASIAPWHDVAPILLVREVL